MNGRRVLDGVKVLEWTTAATGPMGGRSLSDYGAEVIKVESTGFLSYATKEQRDSGASRHDAGKRSITLNLEKSEGVELFKRLVGWADVVLQNRRPGVMKKKGLDYDELRKIKEDIIMVNVSIVGQEGPYSDFGGYGPSTMAMAGHFYLTRFPGNDPSTSGALATSDVIGPVYIGIATIAALDYKRRTGKGQCIDLSQIDPMVQFVTPGILDYVVNGRIQKPIGNRDPDFAPHGVYRCKGDDEWCAIAVTTDKEWDDFCKVLGNPSWTKEAKFATFASRKQNEDELDNLVESWTTNYPPRELMETMQKGGVAAGEVQNLDDIFERDPQIRERELYPILVHPLLGEGRRQRWPFILSKTPGEVRLEPLMGEANEYVFKEILGIPNEQFVQLVESGVID